MRGYRKPIPVEDQATLEDAHAFLRELGRIESAGRKATNLGSGRRIEGARQIARKKGWAIYPAKSGGEKGRGWIITDAGRAELERIAPPSPARAPNAEGVT